MPLDILLLTLALASMLPHDAAAEMPLSLFTAAFVDSSDYATLRRYYFRRCFAFAIDDAAADVTLMIFATRCRFSIFAAFDTAAIADDCHRRYDESHLYALCCFTHADAQLYFCA